MLNRDWIRLTKLMMLQNSLGTNIKFKIVTFGISRNSNNSLLVDKVEMEVTMKENS